MIAFSATLYQHPPSLRVPYWLKKIAEYVRIVPSQRIPSFNTSLRLSRSKNPPRASPQDELLNDLVIKASTVLFRTSSVFPFDFFPDTIIIDETKIEIRERTFFLFEKVEPILISDIKTVTVSCGPLFASMYIELVGQQENPDPIRYIWQWQARRACGIIMGLITCYQEGVDLMQLKNNNVTERLIAIGRSA